MTRTGLNNYENIENTEKTDKPAGMSINGLFEQRATMGKNKRRKVRMAHRTKPQKINKRRKIYDSISWKKRNKG